MSSLFGPLYNQPVTGANPGADGRIYDMLLARNVAMNPSYQGDDESWQGGAHLLVSNVDNAAFLDATECCTLSLPRSAATAFVQSELGDVRPRADVVFAEVRSTPQISYGTRVEQYPGLVPGWGALIRKVPGPSSSLPTMLEGSVAVRMPDSDMAWWPYMVFFIPLDNNGTINEAGTRMRIFFPEEMLRNMRADKLFHTWVTPLMMRLAEGNNPLAVRMYDVGLAQKRGL